MLLQLLAVPIQAISLLRTGGLLVLALLLLLAGITAWQWWQLRR